jgi:polysulfide reductase chain C
LTYKLVYDVFHQSPLGGFAAAYFGFLAASSGALFMAATIRLLGLKHYSATVKAASLVALLTAGLAGLVIVAELGRPSSFWRAIANINPSSPLSWGTVIFNTFFVLCVLNALAVFRGPGRSRHEPWQGSRRGSLPLACMVVALLIPLYTSLELVLARLSPVWYASLIPVSSFMAAGVAGPSAVILIASLASSNPMQRLGAARLGVALSAPEAAWLARLVRAFVFLMAGTVLVQLLVWFAGHPVLAQVAGSVTRGRLAPVFWVGYFCLGTMAPLLVLSSQRLGASGRLRVTAAVLALTGVFVLRWLDLLSGQSVGPL